MREVFPDRVSMLVTTRASAALWPCSKASSAHNLVPRYSGDARAGSVMTQVFTGGFGPLFVPPCLRFNSLALWKSCSDAQHVHMLALVEVCMRA